MKKIPGKITDCNTKHFPGKIINCNTESFQFFLSFCFHQGVLGAKEDYQVLESLLCLFFSRQQGLESTVG